mmetsp:Transcript_62521/g.110783  ORF Transcript_62521/g.110783 Transcript_62521/m.110783 type:complete len:96 (+) Transcript_62521:454-741(+)
MGNTERKPHLRYVSVPLLDTRRSYPYATRFCISIDAVENWRYAFVSPAAFRILSGIISKKTPRYELARHRQLGFLAICRKEPKFLSVEVRFPARL